MHHQGVIIRPPNEGDSILLQVSTGCSHNKCTFCGAFKGERFGFKDMETVRRDVAWAARNMPGHRRLFLCGGDSLVMPQKRLLDILALVRRELPRVTRVGAYANAKAVAMKSDAQLCALREAGLGIAYMGLESGDDATLAAIRKHGDADAIVQAGRRVRAAGMRLNVTVLLGIAGRKRSLEHARATASALSRMQPDFVGALTLMLMENTPLYHDWRRGDFTLPDARGMLLELRELLAHTDLERALFLSNHASNYLPLKVRLPGGKAQALTDIDSALAGDLPLRPEAGRRL